MAPAVVYFLARQLCYVPGLPTVVTAAVDILWRAGMVQDGIHIFGAAHTPWIG